MSGTAKTTAQLQAEFPDNTSGSITPLDERDVIVSGPQWDDPANVSTLSAPAILRGTVMGHLANGVTVGAGQSLSVRQATAAGLQAAMNYAASAQKFFELIPNIYEIDSAAGLIVPAGNFFDWHGADTTQITQFHVNAPILSVGDCINGTAVSLHLKIDGVNVTYGVDQTGQINANALQFGTNGWCQFNNMHAAANYDGSNLPVNPAYRQIYFTPGSATSPFFASSTMTNLRAAGAQKTLLDISMIGTENVWINTYLTQGNPQAGPLPLLGPALNFASPSSGAQFGTTFDALNVEWTKVSTAGKDIVFFSNIRDCTVIDMHVEGCALAQAGTSLFNLPASQVNFIGLNMLNIRCLAADSPSSVFMFKMFSGEAINIDGWLIDYDTAGLIDTAFQIFHTPYASFGTAPPAVTVRGFVFNDAIGYSAFLTPWDDNDTEFTLPTVMREYDFDTVTSTFDCVNLNVSANHTHYGKYKRAFITVPAALGADITLTLSNKMKSAGAGSTLPTAVGSIVHVLRAAGSATHNLIVVDQAGSTTLTTNSTANVNLYYRFDGTNWSAFT